MGIISPPQADATPEMDRRTALIASLRTLANLYEDIPDLPLMVAPEIHWSILGSDEDARALVGRLAADLADEDVKHETFDDPDSGIGVTIPLVGGYRAHAVHVYDRRMSAYYARASYASNIQVELPVEQDSEVSA